MGHGTGGPDVSHFAVYKAVAGHRHVGLFQRHTVIGLGSSLGGQGHGALVDGQLSVRCLGYDVLTGSIHRVHGAVGKLRIIGTRVGAGGGDGNTGEVRASGSAGVAFHSLLGAVIGPGLAVGGQLYILIVVEVDHIRAGANDDGLAGIADRCAARNRDGRLIQRLLEGQACNSLGFMYLLRGSVPVVVYGCGQVGAFGVVQVDNVVAGSNGQGFLIGAVVGITIDCNDFIGSLYDIVEGHAILYLLSMQDVAGVLLQIVHPIAQVGTLGDGAGNGHVLGGHLKAAGSAPAGEGIAGCGGSVGYGHAGAVLVGCLVGQLGCACGDGIRVGIGHLVAVPGVVNINHGAAVGGNGLLLEGLGSEAGIDFGCCLGQFPGGTAHVVGIGQLIPVIFQILLVVLDGVCGSGCGVPLGGIGCVSGNGSGNGRIPSGEHIAGTGGILTESGGCRAVAHIFGYPIFEHSLTDYAVRIGHGVGIPVIVNPNHGAAVGGNGHLVEALGGKSGIRSGYRCGQFPGGTAHFVGIGQRILVVCQILLVVLNLVSGIVPGNIVDRVHAAALHLRTRSGVGGIRGIQLITLELVLRGRDTVRGNGDHGRAVIDPRGTGYVKALLFGAVNGVTHGVLGGLGLVAILYIVDLDYVFLTASRVGCYGIIGGNGSGFRFFKLVAYVLIRGIDGGSIHRHGGSFADPAGCTDGSIGIRMDTILVVLYMIRYLMGLAVVLYIVDLDYVFRTASRVGCYGIIGGNGSGFRFFKLVAYVLIRGIDGGSIHRHGGSFADPAGCTDGSIGIRMDTILVVLYMIRYRMGLALVLYVVNVDYVILRFPVSCHIVSVGNIHGFRFDKFVAHELIRSVDLAFVNIYEDGAADPVGYGLGRAAFHRRTIPVVIYPVGHAVLLGVVLYIVDLDHIGVCILTNGQGQIIGVVKLVAGFGLLGVFVDHIAELCGAGLGLGRNTNAVVVVFYGITNRLFLPAARECYILGGHGEGAVGNFRVLRSPANEVIAGQGRLLGYTDSGVISAGSIFGRFGCICGDSSGVPILYSKVGLLPLGGEGHVFGGHGEGACLDLVRADLRRSPAGEFVAGPGGLLGNDVHNGAFVLPVRCAMIPAAAVQVIGHEVARHVLGVEGGIRIQGIGEVHLAAGAGLVGVPAVEGVGHAVSVFGCGQIGDGRELAGIGGSARLVVLGGLLHVAGITRVPQLVHCGVNALRLDFHGAVHVLIGVGGVISGNLEGMDMDVLHVSFRNGHAKVLFHFGLVGVEDSCPMIALGDIAALKPGRPADDTAGNAVAVLVAVLPLGAFHIDGTFTQRSAPTGGIGFGISIGVNEVIEQRTVRRACRGSYGDLVGLCKSRSVLGGHRIADFRLAGSHCGHVAVLVHGENFLAAALPLMTGHVRIGGLNGGSQLGIGESGHGVAHTGQGHIRDRNDVPHGNGMGSSEFGRFIGDGDGSGASLHAGNETGLGHGEGIRITALPSEVHLGTGRLGSCRQLGRDTHNYGVLTGDGNAGEGSRLNRNFEGIGSIRMGMIPPLAVIAIGMGHGHGTCRQTLQSCRGSGTADFRLCRVSGFPFSGVITPPVFIARTSQGDRVANIDGLLGGSSARGGSLRIRSAGQQVAQLVQNAAALGLVFHGRLLRVGGGFRSDGLAGGLAGLDGGVVHVDNPALLRAVRGIGHGGDAGGNAVDEGVQGIALGGGDGSGSEVIAGPAAALGKTRGQGDGLPHGDTPIRIFLAFGQSPPGLGLRGLGLRRQSPRELGPLGQSSLGQSLLGLGRLRFLLRFRRNRVRGGSLLRCARICRRLGDHGLRLGHFRSGAMDSKSAGGAERHDHAQSQESCNQSSLHGDVPPWIIYVKLTILYGNNGRGESLFPVYARIISCRAMSSL